MSDSERNASESPSEELARLARETLDAQAATINMAEARERCQRVIDIYAQGLVQTGIDYFHAAWVLLCGETQTHFEFSRTLARRATELGEERAWTLRAMSWDRLLVAQGRPQRYGTQIVKLEGRWTLGTVDQAITDLERAFYGVPPLYVQIQRAEQLQRQERDDD